MFVRAARLVVTGSAIAVATAAPALADCPPAWSTDCSLGTCELPGLNGPAYCAAVYDDGSGLSLYVGGSFSVAGTVRAGNLARWDGLRWHPVIDGVDGPVYAMTVYDNQLIIGGAFHNAGSVAVNNLATYDSTQGFNTYGNGFSDDVHVLNSFNTVLYAGGLFTNSGPLVVNHISQFGNGLWDINQQGVTSSTLPGDVTALAVYRDLLYVGGTFDDASGVATNYIAVWNEVNWRRLDVGIAGMNGPVRAMTVVGTDPNDLLVMGGDFSSAGAVPASNIATWDGANFAPLGPGLDASVFALATVDNDVFAGGAFAGAGMTALNRIGRWNGATWSAIGDGANAAVRMFAAFNNRLIIGGEFDQIRGTSASRIASYSPSLDNMVSLGQGLDAPVHTAKVSGSDIFLGGEFLTAPRGVAAARIAQFDGTNWHALADGLDNTVNDIEKIGSTVYAVGAFANAGSVAALRVAAWDGTTWSALADGVDAEVRAAIDFNGQLVIGGAFANSGATPTLHVARWNGTAWEQLGAGLDGDVLALIIYNNDLYAAGEFLNSGMTACPRLARFDGTDWQPVAADLDGRVRALAVLGNQLIIGGAFTVAGGTTVDNGVAAFDGTSFTALAGGWNAGEVAALASVGQTLLASGEFTVTGQTGTRRVFSWDGTVWSELGPSPDGPVLAFEPFTDGLLALGDFTQAGGRVADNVARILVGSVPPVIDTPPTDTAVCAGQPLRLTVAASGSDPISYQWRKGTTNIDGATSAALDIAAAAAGDAGSYDCVITNPCGSVTTTPVNVTINAGPAISTQPGEQSVCNAAAASFTVVATGDNLTYQWRKDTNDITGATLATLNIASATATDAGSYDCVVTNSCGSVTTNAVTLSVGTGVTIDTQPSAISGCLSSDASLTVAASGAGLTYQWRKGGQNVTGATSATLSFASLATTDAGSYDCVITSPCSSATTNAVEVTVSARPAITRQPLVQVLNAGDNLNLAITATGTAPLTYQWRKDGRNVNDGGSISGAKSASLRVASSQTTDSGNYDCVVTNGCASVTSNRVPISIRPLPTNNNANANANTNGNANSNTNANANGNSNGNANVNGSVTRPAPSSNSNANTNTNTNGTDPNDVVDMANECGAGLGCGTGAGFTMPMTMFMLFTMKRRKLGR